MKRKRLPPTVPVEEAVIPEALLEQAKMAIQLERFRKPVACTVCSGECSANTTDGLCWVCRRLKLSAWRDSDSQMPAQE
ncbi:MAG: hypothetical protein ABI995_01480 [Acidobacteriota bacterium]